METETEKEHKEDDIVMADSGSSLVSQQLREVRRKDPFNASANGQTSTRQRLVNVLIGNCTGMCASFPMAAERAVGRSTQFVELHGLRFIGLGAMVDELTPKERVYDTLEQLTARSERLISIGYIMKERNHATIAPGPAGALPITKTTAETVPLDVWNQQETNKMTSQVKHLVDLMMSKQFKRLKEELSKAFRIQKTHPNKDDNQYLAGITAHNLGVVSVLTGNPDEAVAYFREAICLKENSFGRNDRQVALSWDELGIQFFARGDFDGALTSFREAHSARSSHGEDSSRHPRMAMVLNNMACCYFQMGNHPEALKTLLEADEIQQRAIGSSAQDELDILHVAIVICNIGYLKLSLKQYEEGRSLLEEALLIQQSVLDDNHRAVRDTLSNIEFANAFHS